MKHTAAYIACLAVALCAGVHAATVNNAYNSGDPRYMTTGCKFENSFSSGGSIGIWVKNISDYANGGASVFGSCHVNTGTSNDQGILLYINSSGNFAFRVAGLKNGAIVRKNIEAENSSGSRIDDKWHFLLGTFDIQAGKARFYVDGEEVGWEDISIDSLVSARCFAVAKVGKPTESTSVAAETYGGINGLYAEATLWNKALSADEVATLCTRRAYPWDDGQIGYWPLAKTSANLAQNATLRNDGSRPNALNYHRQTATDADFFDDPPARFVASAEWAEEKGYVQADGVTFNNPDEPATNATEAVAAASAGETIFLMSGTHPIFAQIDIAKANLAVTGKYGGYDGGEAIVDAQGLCRHFRCSSDNSGQSGFVIENLTLANGAAGGGGSMYFKSRTGTIRNCVFRNNATTGTSSGGAIHSYTANGTIVSNCVFFGNTATAYGGAIYTQQNSGTSSDRCIIANCIITNNTAARCGGGIYAERCIEIDGCLFAGNTANTQTDYRRGGAIYAGIYSKITGSAFTGGSAAVYGSAIELAGNNATVSKCSFAGLSATGSYGVIHANKVSNCQVFNCAFTNTAWSSGSQLFFSEGAASSLTVRQCLIVPNSGSGAVVNNYTGGQTRFENCTILASSFDSKVTGPGQNVLVNSIVPNADISSSGTFANIITNSCVKSVTGGTEDCGVIVGNPRFVDAENGDYSLKHNSPCRDRGFFLDWMTTDATDIIGNPRVVTDGRPLAEDPAALPDIGCYECMLPHVGWMLMVF